MKRIQTIIEKAWEDRSLLKEAKTKAAIRKVIKLLDVGELRVAHPNKDGDWTVNQWVKKAVVMYFPIQQMKTIEVKPFEFHDKIPLKKNYKKLGVRVATWCICRSRCNHDAQLCQHWSLRRFRYNGGYLGYRWFLCANW